MAKHARVLTDDEFTGLLDYVDTMKFGSRNRLILYLTHYAGMRIGEVSSLLHGDLLGHSGDGWMEGIGRANSDFIICVHNVRYRVRDRVQLRRRSVKGKHARSVLLNAAVRGEVQRYYDTLSEQSLELSSPVFLNRFGNPMNNMRLAQEVRRWYEECGLSGCSSHSGRRGFVTNLLDRQVNIKVVQELVGHRQLATTQRYAETLDTRLREAVESL